MTDHSGGTPQILIVGSINADLNISVHTHVTPGETIIATGSSLSPGGKGANQACAAALLGGHVGIVGAIGADPHSQLALERLTDAGVDLATVKSVPDTPTGLAIVSLDAAGENAITVIPGANLAVTKEFVEENHQVIAAAEVVVLQAEIPVESVERVATSATGRVVINLAPYTPLARHALVRADPLVLNELEAKALHAAQWPKAPPQEDYSAIARDLCSLGVRSVVITLGARGSLGISADGQEFTVPACAVTTVDTTGAGDAFVGALAYRLAAGDGLREAVVFATRVAGFSVQRPGAQNSYPVAGDPLPSL